MMAPLMTEAEAADPQLRIVYKEFPILGSNSIFAAKAALAAHKPGRIFHLARIRTAPVVLVAVVGGLGEVPAGRALLDDHMLSA